MLQVVVLLLEEPAVGLLNSMELVEDVERVLQWHWSVKGLHYIYHPPLGPTHPIGKLHIVGHRS